MTKFCLYTTLLILCLYTICIQSYAFCIQSTKDVNNALKDNTFLTQRADNTHIGVKTYKLTYNADNILLCRVTAANFRSTKTCEGKNLRKLAKQYGLVCAVEQNTLPLYTPIYIPEVNHTYTIVDYIPKRSTNKHNRRADKKGIDIDTCIDRYVDVPTRELKHYDLGYTEIIIK